MPKAKTRNTEELPEGWRRCYAEGKCHNCGTTLYAKVDAKPEDESLTDAYIIAVCFSMFRYPCENCEYGILPTDFCPDFIPPPPISYIWFDNTDEHGYAHFPDPPRMINDKS
jgi:hypothetical protein